MHAHLRMLTTPWVDKAIALLALTPFIVGLAENLSSYRLEIPWLGWFLSNLILVSTMVFRRTPSRVTSNLWFWLLTLVATYWSFLPLLWSQQGRALAPSALLNALSLVGCAVEIWGRLSLGRNIGFVPAQRELVAHGAYRFMRHPIYTGVSLSGLGYALAYYSPRNALFIFLLILWFAAKSLAEESFLRQDPGYVAYIKRVRWRWLPGVV